KAGTISVGARPVRATAQRSGSCTKTCTRRVGTCQTSIRTHSLKHRPLGLAKCIRPCKSFYCFQAEDGIRDATVIGVQTCALPICLVTAFEPSEAGEIKELVLQDAQRGKGRGTEFKWADIPGARLILLGPTIHSINMRYVFVKIGRTSWREK